MSRLILTWDFNLILSGTDLLLSAYVGDCVIHIEFATLPDIKRGTKYVSLSAVSSCGLPVDFYVESGPAYVDGNRLILTAIPPKAAYPVKVTVIAWQYGKNSYPKIKTAEPVKQTFYIR